MSAGASHSGDADEASLTARQAASTMESVMAASRVIIIATGYWLRHEGDRRHAACQPREPQRIARPEDEVPAFRAVRDVKTSERRLLRVQPEAAADGQLVQVQVLDACADVAGVEEQRAVEMRPQPPARLDVGQQEILIVEAVVGV